MTEPENFTVKEIVTEVSRKLDKLSEDMAKVQVVAHTVGDNVESIADHESRLRSLERFKNAIPSIAVLGATVAVADFLMQFFHNTPKIHP